jgi:hypothetical protein
MTELGCTLTSTNLDYWITRSPECRVTKGNLVAANVSVTTRTRWKVRWNCKVVVVLFIPQESWIRMNVGCKHPLAEQC